MKKNKKNVLIGVFIVLILALAAVLLMIFLRIKNSYLSVTNTWQN